MKFSLTHQPLDKIKTDCLILPLVDSKTLPAEAAETDRLLNGSLSRWIKSGDVKGKAGATALIPLDGGNWSRLLVVGLGDPAKLNPTTVIDVTNKAITTLKQSGARKATLLLSAISASDVCAGRKVTLAVQAAGNAMYRFEEFKSKTSDADTLKELSLYVGDSETSRGVLTKAVKQGEALAAGMNFAKDLGNTPGNVCTPRYLAKEAEALAKGDVRLSAEILDEKQMKKLGMNTLLSVSAGSAEPARLIIMNYKGGKSKDKPVVLVGKGITFDSGGISIKPGAQMDEMKYDMGGAASVFGVMVALKALQPAINVVGVVAAAENMPSGTATRPGDIIKTMDGQTVEILNTDAEGRLVLCDALTYSKRFKPKQIIDIATLTGACIIALGHQATAVLGTNQQLATELLAAGEEASDRAWQLPLWDEYQSQLDSNFADMANIGGRPAGTITAACFLSRFVGDIPWAHLDIAGTAWVSGGNKGATGRPVPMLLQHILNQA